MDPALPLACSSDLVSASLGPNPRVRVRHPLTCGSMPNASAVEMVGLCSRYSGRLCFLVLTGFVYVCLVFKHMILFIVIYLVHLCLVLI